MADDKGLESAVRFGVVTDLHSADLEPRGTRHYRETLGKLEKAAAQYKEQKTQFVVELGDFIDAADTVEGELAFLRRINEHFTMIPGEHHYVIGNHCVYTLTKEEFLKEVGRAATYYSFDQGGYHFGVLDACFRNDGQPYGRKNYDWTDANLPPSEVEWLRDDLRKTDNKTIIFIHQRLDVGSPYGVDDAPAIREVVEQSGKVLAVFQGHSHKNDYKEINGIHYCTIAAMVEGSGEENNAFATVDIFADDSIRVTGFYRQASYEWRD
jgi:alkaline phosphatase